MGANRLKMRYFIIIMISILTLNLTHSQIKDTVFLKPDYIIMSEEIFNRGSSELKEGKWINYKLKDYEIEGGALWSGINRNGYYSADTIYRFLKKNEFRGIENIIRNDSTETNEWKRFHYESEIIIDYIKPQNFYIESIGRYSNGKKTGVWKYYNNSDKLIKQEMNN